MLIPRLRELTIGEYEILTELGHGGMAAVYLAWDHALHKHVALKVMSPVVMLTQGMIERFSVEARTQARLEHPHIATVHGVRQNADLHYIVMQYVPGRSLSEVLRAENAAGRRLPLPVIRSLLFHVGSALAHADREGVVHRDVKPGNVLLRANGDAVVTDFGIAKVLSDPSQTMTGTVVGTAQYMSPEQCYAAELTGASDQYSLGVVAYELLTGTPPFTGKSFAVMQAHVSETPAPVTARRADCPAEVEAAILRMLAKKPDDRFADVTEALEAIGAAVAPATPNDPVRRELVRLADADGVRAGLGDVFRGPPSPTPKGATPAGPRVPTPAPHTPVSALVAARPPESSLEITATSDVAIEVVPKRSAWTPARARRAATLGAGAALVGISAVVILWRDSDQRPAPPVVAASSPAPAADSSGPVPASPVGAEVARTDSAPSVRTISRVRLTSPPTRIQVNDTIAIEARAFDSRDALRTDRRIVWHSSNPRVIEVLPTGRLVARRAGTAAVHATADDIQSRQVTLTVQELPTSTPSPTPQPVTGILRVGGNLPPDATLTLTTESGLVRGLVDRTATLDPGSYVLEFRASGYEPDRQTVRVRAGETEMWTPTVRAVQPKSVDPPPRDAAAEEPKLVTAVGEFVAAFNRRDTRTVVASLPADLRDRWRTLLDTREVRNFSASLIRTEPARIAGDELTIRFSMRVRFLSGNLPVEQNLNGVGSMQRSSGAFRIVSLQ